jgi:hypothetical protein
VVIVLASAIALLAPIVVAQLSVATVAAQANSVAPAVGAAPSMESVEAAALRRARASGAAPAAAVEVVVELEAVVVGEAEGVVDVGDSGARRSCRFALECQF